MRHFCFSKSVGPLQYSVVTVGLRATLVQGGFFFTGPTQNCLEYKVPCKLTKNFSKCQSL